MDLLFVPADLIHIHSNLLFVVVDLCDVYIDLLLEVGQLVAAATLAVTELLPQAVVLSL